MGLLKKLYKKTPSKQEMTPNDWIEACKRGDRKAQYYLYNQYKSAMFNLCFRFFKDRQLAEDALQEAFLKAFQKIDLYTAEATFGAWLKRIVINTCINQLKKNKINFEFDTEIPDYPEEQSAEDLWQDQQLKVETIHQTIQMLPQGYRTVLSLYLIEGYEHAEIAEILNISVSTSKTQYVRAKKKLKELIQNASKHEKRYS